MAEPFALSDAANLTAEPAITLAPEDDVRTHADLSNHAVIAIAFPKWRDGRGYSTARILRESGYTGDIRAIGDLTVDQLVFLKRAGFSSLTPDRPINAEHASQALARYAHAYQRAADPAQPAWAIRHPETTTA